MPDTTVAAPSHPVTCTCTDCDTFAGPPLAVAMWTFVEACEDVMAAQPQRGCRDCGGRGCGCCNGLGVFVDIEMVRAMRRVMATAAALCTDAGHPAACYCAGDFVVVPA
jgi:hypothetical protein